MEAYTSPVPPSIGSIVCDQGSPSERVCKSVKRILVHWTTFNFDSLACAISCAVCIYIWGLSDEVAGN